MHALGVSTTYQLSPINFEPAVVLVADDIDSNRDLLREVLIRTGLTVVEASNGHEAVIISESHRPAVVLMDIRMPLMDGFEAIRRLKENPNTAETPVIALTASTTMETLAEIKRSGFVSSLSKPINLNDLLQELSRFIKRAAGAEVGFQNDNTPLQYESAAYRKIKDRAGLLWTLENTILPAWQQLQGAIEIAEIEGFVVEIRKLAERHELPALVAYADQLAEAIQHFDIMEIEEALAGFSTILELLNDNTLVINGSSLVSEGGP